MKSLKNLNYEDPYTPKTNPNQNPEIPTWLRRAGLILMQNHAESSTRRRDRKIDVTPDLEAKMVTLRNEGNSYFEISLALGLPENWTAKHLKDHPEVTFKQNKGKQAVPAEVLAKMVVLRNEGNTYPQIAAELDLSKHSVSKYLKDHPDVTFKSPFS